MKNIYFAIVFLCCCGLSGYSQWLQLNTNTNTSFYTIKFFNANTGIVAGQDTVGKILRTTNGGLNWSIVYRTASTEKFTCNFFIDSQTGWMGTYNGSVYRTTNAGVNWIVASLSAGGGKINSISFIDPLNGWIITNTGGAGRTTDGGSSWYMNAPNFSGNAIHFINSLTGVIGTFQGTIRKSVSAGNGYTEIYQLPSNTLIYDFYFLNSQTGYASGNRKLIMKTTNFGSNWFLVNVDAPETPWENLLSINFIDENLGYAAGYWLYSDINGSYQYGILKKTTNGGVNWTGITLSNVSLSMEDVFITEGQTGYIAGQLNKIYKSTNAGYIGLIPVSSELPRKFQLHQNYPNPFNPSTKIKFEIPSGAGDNVILTIYDALGREVSVLVNENLKPGIYETEFNAQELPSGIFFYKLSAGDFTDTRKMILLK